MSKPDYYEVLEVSREVTVTELKKAYRNKALEFHPDRNPDDAQAEEQFKICAEAYSVLSDPQKRQMYDRFGHAGLGGPGAPGFGDIGDVFSQFPSAASADAGATQTRPREVPTSEPT